MTAGVIFERDEIIVTPALARIAGVTYQISTISSLEIKPGKTNAFLIWRIARAIISFACLLFAILLTSAIVRFNLFREDFALAILFSALSAISTLICFLLIRHLRPPPPALVITAAGRTGAFHSDDLSFLESTRAAIEWAMEQRGAGARKQ